MERGFKIALCSLAATVGCVVAPLAASPDAPISPLEFVNAAGRGFLLEPQTPPISGLPGREHALGAYYQPSHGQIIEDMGFTQVRLRYQVVADVVGEALTAGSPYDDRVLDDMERIVDDLLARDMVVELTFYGLTEDNPGDFDKMTNWWGFVAERFQNKSHRLVFNYFVEPWELGRYSARYAEYLEAISQAIRATNPDRMCGSYYASGSSDDPPFERTMDGNGAEQFTAIPPPPSAGKYWFWDFHVLKSDYASNFRVSVQANEYMNATKIPVWVGAWTTRNTYVGLYAENNNQIWGFHEEKWARSEGLLQKNLQQMGISGNFLMFFDGGTSLYDGDADRDQNGTTNEWMFTQVRDAIHTNFPSLWMNLLENTGFEHASNAWNMAGAAVSVSNGVSGNAVLLGSGDSLSQDVRNGLEINDPGNYDVLLYGKASTAEEVVLRIRLVDDSGEHVAATQTLSVPATGNWELLQATLSVNWTGTLQQAELEVVYGGSSTLLLDNLGLTQFYRTNLVFDPSLWPNGHYLERKVVFGTKTVGSQLVNTMRRDKETLLSSDPVYLDLRADYDATDTNDLVAMQFALDEIDAYLFSRFTDYVALYWQINRWFPPALYSTTRFNKPDAQTGKEYHAPILGRDYWIEGEMPRFHKVSGPAWATVSPDGVLGGVPGSSDLGTNDIVVGVDDFCGTNENIAVHVFVKTATHNAPQFSSDPIEKDAVLVEVPIVGSLAGDATDADNDRLFFSKVSGPAWLLVAADGILSGTPGTNDLGLNQWTVEVTDNYDGTDSATLEIQVNAVNQPPFWKNDPFTQPDAEVGVAYVRWLNYLITDPEGDPTTLAKVSGPDWLEVTNPGNAKIEGTPTVADPGTNVFVVSVSDGINPPVEAVMTIFIPGDPNLPPVWDEPEFFSHYDAVENEAYSRWLNWRASDPEGDSISFAKVSGPTWLALDTNGNYHGTPASSDLGTNRFVFSISDGFHPPVEATMHQIVLSVGGGMYRDWIGANSISDANAGYMDDPDGDGAVNLLEYAMGGDPHSATNQGYAGMVGIRAGDSGLEYLYPARNDASSRGLDYRPEICGNLVDGVWTNAAFPILGTAPLDAGFDAVTNQVPVDAANQEFIRLKIILN